MPACCGSANTRAERPPPRPVRSSSSADMLARVGEAEFDVAYDGMLIEL
jgi:hypothetical protein